MYYFPNYLLVELGRGVCYYIDNPTTFRNFALSCKSFWSACKEYTPMKKNQFRITINQWVKKFTNREPKHTNMHFPAKFDVPLVLPNGLLHGKVVTDANDFTNRDFRRIFFVNSGKIVFMKDRISRRRIVISNCYFYFIKHVVISVGSNYRAFCDLSKHNFISSLICPLCSKFHDFIVDGTSFCYSRNCTDNVFKIKTYSHDRLKRLKIASKVISYAKELSNQQSNIE